MNLTKLVDRSDRNGTGRSLGAGALENLCKQEHTCMYWCSYICTYRAAFIAPKHRPLVLGPIPSDTNGCCAMP